jgi:hypothetical protein
MEKMEIWEQVRTPDPKYTKSFSRDGGFSGTATNTQYTIKRATEVFGPCGIGWGFEITDEKYVEGASINETDKKIVHVIRGRVWYVVDDKKYYTADQFGQTIFVGVNKNGIYTDEEAPKKSATDCMIKCLSMIGFSADIFLGLWDDHKYLAAVQDQYKNGTTNGKPTAQPSDQTCTTAQVEEIEREAKALNVNMEGFLKNLGITGLHLLTTPSYEKAKKMLAWKRQSNGGGTNGNYRN